MKIHPVGATRTDECDEANSQFSQFWKHAKKSVLCTKQTSLHSKTNPQLQLHKGQNIRPTSKQKKQKKNNIDVKLHMILQVE
jgi:hypothetical protein